jgi:hypothetical protein
MQGRAGSSSSRPKSCSSRVSSSVQGGAQHDIGDPPNETVLWGRAVCTLLRGEFGPISFFDPAERFFLLDILLALVQHGAPINGCYPWAILVRKTARDEMA